MSAPSAPSHVREFVDQALQGNTRDAVRLALGLLDDGVPQPRIITDLLAPAQRTVGERWEQNELTVADEHLVTVSTDSALHALAGAVDTPAAGGQVLVACAEGDWHALPAHMFAQQLRSTGLHVTFLGASTPAEHLAALLVRQPVDALVVTCSLPLCFPGVTRLVDAAHELGTPVLAGGRALPGATDRAVRLGADAGAADLTGAVQVLGSWRQQPPTVPREPTALPADALDLESDAHDLAATAYDTMLLRFPTMAGYDNRQLARTREDLLFIVQYLAAARLVRDDTVFTELLDWLAPLLRARGVPDAGLIAGLETLLPHVSASHPTAAPLLRAGLERLTLKDDGS